ncbi:hypothetical protein K439DRAFT_1616127 [Ramaria rubella]|nr:hypothetical protein K439DRAFT_1616127 [Ramaria rubella]
MNAPLAPVFAMDRRPYDPLDRAMARAKVPLSDPPRLSKVNIKAIRSMFETKSGQSLASEAVYPGETDSEVHWVFGSTPHAVDVTLVVADSHDAAVQRMKGAVGGISAPLDDVFASTLPLGQYSLQGVGGYGFILFVRDNLFVSMKDSIREGKLGEVATAVDTFLKGIEGDSSSLPRPLIEQLPSRRVQAEKEFEISVQVSKVGWMSASVNLAVAQLLEVDVARTTFRFYAAAVGTTDINMVFTHEDTLQSTRSTVRVEVVEHTV